MKEYKGFNGVVTYALRPYTLRTQILRSQFYDALDVDGFGYSLIQTIEQFAYCVAQTDRIAIAHGDYGWLIDGFRAFAEVFNTGTASPQELLDVFLDKCDMRVVEDWLGAINTVYTDGLLLDRELHPDSLTDDEKKTSN